MENRLTTVVIFSTFITISFAAVGLGPAQIHKDHPNQCYEADKNAYYSPGESWQLEDCGMATCIVSNYTGTPQLMVSYESCGVVQADPPCYIVEDKSLPYPNCCPQVVCPEEEEIEAENSSKDKTKESNNSKKGEKEEENNYSAESEPENDPMNVYSYTDESQADDDKDEYLNKYDELNKYYERQSANYEDEFDNSIDTDGNNELESYLSPFLNSFSNYQNFYDDMSMRQHKNLRKVSPKFHYVDSSFPDYSYQWF